MANTVFKVLTVPDDQILTAFTNIADSLGLKGSAKVHLTVYDGNQGTLRDVVLG